MHTYGGMVDGFPAFPVRHVVRGAHPAGWAGRFGV